MLLLFSLLFGRSGPTSWPVASNWLLVAARTPFAGDFNPVAPADRVPLTIDFASQIPAGDSLVAAGVSSLTVYYGEDPNAAALLWGSAGISGTRVTQWAGPNWLPSVIYGLTLNATTRLGANVSLYGHVACTAIN